MQAAKPLRLRMHAASAILAGAFASSAWPADIYLIAHPELTLSLDDVREVYLGGQQFAAGVRIVPFDNLAARTEFLQKIKLDVAKYETLWAKKAFREGLNAPGTKATDLEVITTVKGTRGGLGYVTAPPPAGVAVIGKF